MCTGFRGQGLPFCLKSVNKKIETEKFQTTLGQEITKKSSLGQGITKKSSTALGPNAPCRNTNLKICGSRVV